MGLLGGLSELTKTSVITMPRGRRDICKSFGKALQGLLIRTEFLKHWYLCLLLRITGFPNVLPCKFHVFGTLPG